MTNYYFDVDGVLADFHTNYDYKTRWLFTTYEYIRNLKPFTKNVNLVKRLAKNNNIFIITLVANEECKKARVEWIKEYLPCIKEENIIVMFKGRKCDNMKTDDGILVDDKETNCKQWVKAGHKAIYLEEKGGKIIF